MRYSIAWLFRYSAKHMYIIIKTAFTLAYDSESACRQICLATDGDFSSPFYPGMYPNNYRQCVAHIRAPPGSHVIIEFNIVDFDVEEGTINCELDKIEVSSAIG